MPEQIVWSQTAAACIIRDDTARTSTDVILYVNFLVSKLLNCIEVCLDHYTLLAYRTSTCSFSTFHIYSEPHFLGVSKDNLSNHWDQGTKGQTPHSGPCNKCLSLANIVNGSQFYERNTAAGDNEALGVSRYTQSSRVLQERKYQINRCNIGYNIWISSLNNKIAMWWCQCWVWAHV